MRILLVGASGTIGRAIAGNNQFAQLAAGTVFGLVGQKFALTFAASLSADASASVVGDFASDAEIVFDIAGMGARTLSGRDEIRESAMGGFANVPSLKVQFLDATAKVGADKQTAEVNCTARVSLGDNKDFGIQELRFQLKKMDGDWLITRAETVKTLQ